MKILCTREEFSHLVRVCARSEFEDSCRGCTFECVCTKHDALLCEGSWMARIEDVCEIVEGSDG